MKTRIRAVWEAFACGDALGAPTEFMTRSQIVERFGRVEGLIDPARSQNHANLPYASVTDDTEQNVYLLRAYAASGRADVLETARALLDWAQETGAEEKKYIGPSSLQALHSIRQGGDPYRAGLSGTTCGGMMRTPCAVLFRPDQTQEELEQNILNCLIPTHYTSTALEAAGAYGFALRRALAGADRDEILAAAYEGAARLAAKAPWQTCAPSCAKRIALWEQRAAQLEEDELLDELYDIYGTGLPSADVCGAVFAIFLAAGRDVLRAVGMAASAGGDTDTIAALAGGLCAAWAGGHNIPQEVVTAVARANGLNFEQLAQLCAPGGGR